MSEVSPDKEFDVHQLSLRIERDYFRLQNFLIKLNSYTCEPTDYNCFVVSNRLKNELQNLRERQAEIIKKIRDHAPLNKADQRKINSCLRDYQQLELDFEVYLSRTNNHYNRP